MKKIYYRIPMLMAAALTAVTCYIEKPFPDDEELMGEQLPAWQTGYLDIHHISTGRGDCTFMILPDGTTMMVDAGDLSPKGKTQEIMELVPDSRMTAGGWISLYAKKFLTDAGLQPDKLDYFLVTHFHDDHVGNPLNGGTSGKGYIKVGVSEVGSRMQVGKIVDRGWPYDSDCPNFDVFKNSMVMNYRAFLTDRGAGMDGDPAERFVVGSNEQFALKYDKTTYPDFEIRNIYCNGDIWVPSSGKIENLIPEDASSSAMSDENIWSSVINVKYGKFSYHCGGDILNTWNIETRVAEAIGQTDVYSCDHHANGTMVEAVLRATTPQVFVIPVWDYYHPQPPALRNMTDKTIYADDRYIYPAGMLDSNRERLKNDGSDQILQDGHIVIRVYEGGETFQVFVLNDRSIYYDVLHKSQILTSK